MKHNQFFGWQEVCRFTYVQCMKSKAMKITLAILCIILLLALPVITLLTSNEEEAQKTEIGTAYLYCENEILADCYMQGLQTEPFADVSFVSIGEAEMEQKRESLKAADEDNTEVLVNVVFDADRNSMDYGIEFHVIYGKNSKVTEEDADAFGNALMEERRQLLLKQTDLPEESFAKLLQDMQYEVTMLDLEGMETEIDNGLNDMEYNITYAWLMCSMLIIIFSGSQVAQLIVTEKTSRVMEYLLTSVRPMALLIGKIAATLMITLSMFFCMAVALFASFFLTSIITGDAAVIGIVKEISASGVWRQVNVLTVLMALAMILCGFLFYEFLAGLAGATVSKTEELAEGLKIFSFAVLIGVYMVLALVTMSVTGSSMGAFGKFVCYCPLSSAFVTPMYLLLGKVTVMEGGIALLLLVAAVFVMWLFVSVVFERVLYHSEGLLKLKDILNIFKERKVSLKNTGVHHEK